MNMKKQNLIYIFADQWRYHAMGCAEGDQVLTPNMDAFAKESLCFENAYSTFYPDILTSPAFRTPQSPLRRNPSAPYSPYQNQNPRTAMKCILREDDSTYHTYFIDRETGNPAYGASLALPFPVSLYEATQERLNKNPIS